MALKTVTFRLPEEKLQALDSVAKLQQRDRSIVINEAVTQYLSLYDYHRALIEEGIRQDEAGNVVTHEAVLNMVAGLTGYVKSPRKSRRDG
jgi:RHH-type transcriptional regulator, rel operon repressor / antitoxin RelB